MLKFDRTSGFLTSWGGKGTGPGQFEVVHIAIDADGLLWVMDRENQRIQVFDAEGTFVREMTYAGLPCSVDIGREYVARLLGTQHGEGSRRVARQTGRRAAMTPTAASRHTAPTSDTQSSGATPKTRLLIVRLTMAASTRPCRETAADPDDDYCLARRCRPGGPARLAELQAARTAWTHIYVNVVAWEPCPTSSSAAPV